MAGDITKYRADFPVLRKQMNGQTLAWLDSGASAQKPQAVIDAMSFAMNDHYANIHRGLYAFSQAMTHDFELVRTKVAKFIGANAEAEVVFTRNATEAINLAAQSWGRTFLKAGDEIILTGMEHHANLVPWQILKDQNGLQLKFIPILEDGSLDLNAFEKLLSPRTRLVACVHISNVLGTVNDVKRISEVAKKFNPEIRVLVDGSQSVVHRPVNVRDLGCDFFAFTGHKLYGPTGVGVLWGKYEVLQSMPPYQGGGDMVDTVTLEKTTFKDAPARFEAGTPAIVEVIGLGAAIDYVNKVGTENIEAHEAALLKYATDRIDDIDGLRIIGTAPGKAGIVSMTADWAHPSDIAMILDQLGVAVRSGHHCCQPLHKRFGLDATVRASLGLYSNENDIDSLVAGLLKARKMLA